VRSLISDVLRRRGYRLLVAESGRQAIELVSRHKGPIDLLITDMVLSGMNGLAVADAMRATHPSHQGVVRVGYTMMRSMRVFRASERSPEAVHAGRARTEVRAVLDYGVVFVVQVFPPTPAVMAREIARQTCRSRKHAAAEKSAAVVEPAACRRCARLPDL